MKKIFALTLVLSMVLAICPLGAFAETTSGSCGENVTWSFDSETGTLIISGEGEMWKYGYGYGGNTPWRDYIIQCVVIEEGVTSIGKSAFSSCDCLTSITIPKSVTSIGDDAFYDCLSLESIAIPDSVTSIGSGAFAWCRRLTIINIPEGVISIGGSAFEYCPKLTSVTIPESVTSIGNYAFYKCKSLTSITIDENNNVYRSAGNCIIDKETGTLIVGCNNSVIPNDGSVISIGDYAFRYCDSLTNITIPESVTSIGHYAFDSCASLTSIIIPDGVTSIGHFAFCNCESLISISIPKSVTSIEYYAFSGCNSLTDVYYGSTEEEWNEISVGNNNHKLLNAEIHFACAHKNAEWNILEDNTKEKVCNNCGEVLETLGADEFIPNDVNGDNKFNMFDYVAVKNACIKGTNDEALFARADVNGDGKLNIFDYVAIKAAYFAK